MSVTVQVVNGITAIIRDMTIHDVVNRVTFYLAKWHHIPEDHCLGNLSFVWLSQGGKFYTALHILSSLHLVLLKQSPIHGVRLLW